MKKEKLLEKGLKHCPKCNTVKPISEFTKYKLSKDGLNYHCRQCNHDHYIANKANHQALMQAWRDEHPDYGSDYYKQYYRDNIEDIRTKQSIKYYNNQAMILANREVRRAIINGDLIVPDHCEGCGCDKETRQLDAHHYKGYSEENRLNVKFLCRSCHRKADHNFDKK